MALVLKLHTEDVSLRRDASGSTTPLPLAGSDLAGRRQDVIQATLVLPRAWRSCVRPYALRTVRSLPSQEHCGLLIFPFLGTVGTVIIDSLIGWPSAAAQTDPSLGIPVSR